MVSRTIEIDEANDARLQELVESAGGDWGMAIINFLESCENMQKTAEQTEAANETLIHFQLADSERTFAQGRGVPWEAMKERNRL